MSVTFFSSALTAYKTSQHAFRVLCTLSRLADVNSKAQPQPNQEPASRPPSPARIPSRLIVLDSSFNPPTTAHLDMVQGALASTLGDGAVNIGDNSNSVRVLLLLALANADKAPKPAAFEQRLAMMWAFAGDLARAEMRRRGRGGGGGGGGGEIVPIDIGVTTRPLFHDKSSAIVDSGFYATSASAFLSSSSSSSSSLTTRQPEQMFLIGYDTLIRVFDPKYYSREEDSSSSAPAAAAAGSIRTRMQIALDPFMQRARLRVMIRTSGAWGDVSEQMKRLKRLQDGSGFVAVGGREEWRRRIEVEGEQSGRREEGVSSSAVRNMLADWRRNGAGPEGEEGWWRDMVSEEVAERIVGEKMYMDM